MAFYNSCPILFTDLTSAYERDFANHSWNRILVVYAALDVLIQSFYLKMCLTPLRD